MKEEGEKEKGLPNRDFERFLKADRIGGSHRRKRATYSLDNEQNGRHSRLHSSQV